MFNDNAPLVGWASLFVIFGAPALVALAGMFARGLAAGPAERWNWRLSINSGLLQVIAFCLIFLLQEIFLVLPKAFVPGLEPTLYHNNHTWRGDDPLASLFQGTGALVCLLTATGLLVWLRRSPPRSLEMRLLVLWLAFDGFFESIPQFVVGAALPANDVGMAMTYFGLTLANKLALAFMALIAIAGLSIWFARAFLELEIDHSRIDTPRKRVRFVSLSAVLPAFAALPAIILFRVPGSLDQVVLVPVAVALIGMSWMLPAAARIERVRYAPVSLPRSPRTLLIATLLLLLVFQIVLRPGIHFY